MIPITQLSGRLGNQMFQLAHLYAEAKKGNIPDIYVQDPKYFKGCEEEIKALFRQGIGKPIDKVALHCRRGDYVNNSFYVDLATTDYYEKAMKEFPDEKFLVFSDDIEWCKAYFDGDEYEFCEEEDAVKSLNMMMSCKGVITANSSFSYWGGYLCNGKVVAPRRWYTDGNTQRTVCPSSWLVV